MAAIGSGDDGRTAAELGRSRSSTDPRRTSAGPTRPRCDVKPKVELLWFAGCPNHEDARALLAEVLAQLAPGTPVDDIDASDPRVAEAHRFPGSPTIRINERDVQPDFVDSGEYTPRCRIYWTPDGLRGVPARAWIENALRPGADPA